MPTQTNKELLIKALADISIIKAELIGNQKDGKDGLIAKVNKHDTWLNYMVGVMLFLTLLGSSGAVYAAVQLLNK